MKNPIQFVQMPNFSDDINERIIEFLTTCFKVMIGDTEDVTHLVSFDQTKGKSDFSGDTSEDESQTPYIIVIDNAQRLDKVAWGLFGRLAEEGSGFAVILLMQTDDLDRINIREDSAQEFEKVMISLIQYDYQIIEKDLPRIDSKSLGQLIRQNSRKYL